MLRQACKQWWTWNFSTATTAETIKGMGDGGVCTWHNLGELLSHSSLRTQAPRHPCNWISKLLLPYLIDFENVWERETLFGAQSFVKTPMNSWSRGNFPKQSSAIMTIIYLAVAPALFTIISGGFIFIGQTSDLGLSTETQFPIFGLFDMIVICFLFNGSDSKNI